MGPGARLHRSQALASLVHRPRQKNRKRGLVALCVFSVANANTCYGRTRLLQPLMSADYHANVCKMKQERVEQARL